MGKQKASRAQAAISAARRKLGLDHTAEFVGYAIQHVESGDFLSLYQQQGPVEAWGWSASIEYAIPYSRLADARYPAGRFSDPVRIVVRFRMGDTYYCAALD